MRLHYQAEGQGTPLIVLHGFLGSLDNFRTLSRRLSAKHTVYSVDLRNHGRSPHADVMNYAVMAEDILEFLNDRNLPRAALLGHSMGGKVSMQLATSHPERVDKLIVVDIAPRDYPLAQVYILEAMGRLDLSHVTSYGDIDAALASDVHNVPLRRLVLKNIGHDPANGFNWKVDLPAITANYEALTKNIEARRKFTGPACFIRGGRSKYVQDEDIPRIRVIFPNAEIVEIPQAGHWVHADAPENFLHAVNEFLDRPEPDLSRLD
jgi:pimeloyl-ACP methyl ester carboxylesterase